MCFCLWRGSCVHLIWCRLLRQRFRWCLGIARDEYGANLPAGRIGKSLIFKVKDVMKIQGELPVCKEDMIMDQLVELTSKGCGCLYVFIYKLFQLFHYFFIFSDVTIVYQRDILLLYTCTSTNLKIIIQFLVYFELVY
ncbi:hypothetical protein GIB67_026840 [Kingdonia uniflora]|uniref:Uncharacterized protein n=1 Tax=Kingdonia uniflora TaxID=39325 RepID=A0A7J7M7R3_9MAGN|nr:hypothetical protein GIB67_026840 [Kingdonia uniflora]